MLFDGECNLCNGTVQFCLDHERDASLRFAALQSDAARELLDRVLGEEASQRLREGEAGIGPGSFVLVEESGVTTASTAALRLARHLRAPWRWSSCLLWVPARLRDAVYGVVARNRYRWFGKTEMCRVRTPDLASRFLA